MRPLPVRIRVTLVFTVVMAIVLALTGFFVYDRTRADLDNGIDRDLQKRAATLATAIRVNDVGLGEPARSLLRDRQLGFSQVLTSRGRLFDAARQFGEPVLSPSQAASADAGQIFLDRADLSGFGGEHARLLATRIRFEHHTLITVVSASLADRDHALETLRELLLIGGPIALLLAAAAAYLTVAAALRPVEAMRARAGEISDTNPGRRLPVPAADDELHRLGSTLNAMLERIQAGIERERAFVDDASHELRTPLAVQRAELELALRHAESPAQLREAIVSAIAETDRLAALADDLLLLARADKGVLQVDPRPVEVSDVLDVVAERERERVGAARRSLRVEELNGLVVRAEAARLEQAMSNLVDNALLHGAGEIQVTAERRNGSIELHVRDSGAGFPADFLPHAFERFRRADGSRAGEGTGLGLAIVAAIARAHGGSAHAENRPAGGADVWIELPDEQGDRG